MPPKMKSIVDELRSAIENCGEDRATLARKTGVNEGQLSRFMTDDKKQQRDLRLETAAKLCAHLGLHLRSQP